MHDELVMQMTRRHFFGRTAVGTGQRGFGAFVGSGRVRGAPRCRAA